MTAPSTTSSWLIVNCTSPVPGGRSRKRTSRGPQETEWRSWCIAFVTMRPRQEIGVVSMGVLGWDASGSGCGRR